MKSAWIASVWYLVLLIHSAKLIRLALTECAFWDVEAIRTVLRRNPVSTTSVKVSRREKLIYPFDRFQPSDVNNERFSNILFRSMQEERRLRSKRDLQLHKSRYHLHLSPWIPRKSHTPTRLRQSAEYLRRPSRLPQSASVCLWILSMSMQRTGQLCRRRTLQERNMHESVLRR